MRPLYEEQAYEDSPQDKGIVDFIFAVKDAFYSSDQFGFAKQKAEVIKNLIQLVHAKGSKRTKYGFIGGVVNGAYQSTLDTMEDLVDTDELIQTTAINRGGDNVALVEGLGHYANTVLMGCQYKQHLYERFPYLLTYGHSPAFDTWQHNQGWAVKAAAASSGPGDFAWTREMDVVLNRVKCIAPHPFNVFGSVEHNVHNQPYRGWIKRWTIADVVRAEAKKDANGRPLYNPKGIAKMKGILGKKGQEADQHFHQDGKRDLGTQQTSSDRIKQPYVDVVYFQGPLNLVDGLELDPNIYEVECIKGCVLRKTEQPVDDYKSITDMMTHPYMGSPFGGTFMDAIVGHQRIGDLLQNLTLENLVDSMHRYYTYRYEDIANMEDLRSPRGLQTFLELTGINARPPQLIEGQRNGPAMDALQFLKVIDTDRQRLSVTDQETGLSDGDKTLGESKILLAGASKRIRAALKRMSTFGITPQVKNIVFLSMVNQSAEQRRTYTRDGKEIVLTPAHAQAFFTNTIFRINDTVTRNKHEDNLKNAEFYINAFKILGNIQDPTFAIKILRYLGKESGIKDIDENLPPPAPIQAGVPGQAPPMAAQPAPAGPMDFDTLIQQARQPERELRVAA
jgi:hypothetical protein